MSERLELTWAGYAAIVHPANIAGVREPNFVMHACEARPKGYFCTTHDQHLANLGNLTMHVESGGVHCVAVWCPKHRVYEAPDDAQIDHFRKLSIPTLGVR